MIDKSQTLSLLCNITGKEIVLIYNDIEKRGYFFLLDNYKLANPGNYIFENSIKGRDISPLVDSLQSYINNFDTSNNQSILTKIDELPLISFTFRDFRWVKFQNS